MQTEHLQSPIQHIAMTARRDRESMRRRDRADERLDAVDQFQLAARFHFLFGLRLLAHAPIRITPRKQLNYHFAIESAGDALHRHIALAAKSLRDLLPRAHLHRFAVDDHAVEIEDHRAKSMQIEHIETSDFATAAIRLTS